MNILIIYCHPSKKSYTFQILERLKELIKCQQWQLDISDLYANHFQSEVTQEEYESEKASNYDFVSSDLQTEYLKMDQADCILFLYPVWWSDCPAKLKGWFDRMFSLGYITGRNPNIPHTGPIKFGMAICTAGHPMDYLEKTGVAQSMRTIMLDDRFGKRFMKKEMLILGGTLEIEKVRNLHQQELEALISKIKNNCA